MGFSFKADNAFSKTCAYDEYERNMSHQVSTKNTSDNLSTLNESCYFFLHATYVQFSYFMLNVMEVQLRFF